MSIYPKAIWAPWKFIDNSNGAAAYYKGLNKPEAVVLHIMQGWMSTVLSWAETGYSKSSWHFSVARDGRVFQHLDFKDGGYHAGIAWNAPAPTWPLWKGHGVNVNHYTIGIEHEGMYESGPMTDPQRAASRDLCRWLAKELGIPYDRDHFPPHADIDVVNRKNDFNTPRIRDAHYAFMFGAQTEEDDMDQRIEELVIRLAATRMGDAPGDHPDVIGFYVDEFRKRDTGDHEIEQRLDNLNATMLDHGTRLDALEADDHFATGLKRGDTVTMTGTLT